MTNWLSWAGNSYQQGALLTCLQVSLYAVPSWSWAAPLHGAAFHGELWACSCFLASTISGPLSHGHDPTAEFPHRHSTSRSLQKFSFAIQHLGLQLFSYPVHLPEYHVRQLLFSHPTCLFVPSAKIWQICSFYSFMFCVHLKSVAVSNYYGMQKNVYCHSRSSYFQLNTYSNWIESILFFF